MKDCKCNVPWCFFIFILQTIIFVFHFMNQAVWAEKVPVAPPCSITAKHSGQWHFQLIFKNATITQTCTHKHLHTFIYICNGAKIIGNTNYFQLIVMFKLPQSDAISRVTHESFSKNMVTQITADTEQDLTRILTFFLGIWKPFTTNLWTLLTLPNMNTSSLHS